MVEPQVQRVRRVPTAVTIVGAIALVAIAVALLNGILLGMQLAQQGVLQQDWRTWVDLYALEITPTGQDVVSAVGDILGAVVMLVIVIAFLRLRRWAWVALMTYCAVALANNLIRYYTDRPQYLTLLLLALLVLLLNQEDVQTTFLVRAPRERRIVLPAPDPAHRV